MCPIHEPITFASSSVQDRRQHTKGASMQCRHDHTERKRETAWAAPFTAVLLCVIFLTFGCTGPSSYRWTELPQAQFPAQVNQIITEYGNLLDRRHRAGYGEWDVSAISEPPMATYTCLPHEACHIVVSKLHCVNAHSEKDRVCRAPGRGEQGVPIVAAGTKTGSCNPMSLGYGFSSGTTRSGK